jgi:SAM-dependent methyltransferase
LGKVGIDVSKTAIAMAREQSKGLNVSFRVGDVCSLAGSVKEKFDVIVDGHALHCITSPERRIAAFDGVRDCLRENGVFILMTICAPVLRKTFSRLYPNQLLVDGTILVPCPKESGYMDLREINSKSYFPTRRIERWTTLLRQLRGVGFQPMLLRFNHCVGEEASSTLNAAFMLSEKRGEK